MKRCCRCDTNKSLSEFRKDRQKSDGLDTYCKSCRRAYESEYRAREHVILRARKTNRAWKHNNPEKVRASNRAWVARNPDKRKDSSRKYYETHREKIREYSRMYSCKNRDKENTKTREWRRKNRAKALEYKHRRRGFLENNGYWESQQWDKLLAHYAPYGQCLACGQTSGTLTVDHVVPLCIGGTNDPFNLQCLCKSCNSQKPKRIPVDYRPDGGAFMLRLLRVEQLRPARDSDVYLETVAESLFDGDDNEAEKFIGRLIDSGKLFESLVRVDEGSFAVAYLPTPLVK